MTSAKLRRCARPLPFRFTDATAYARLGARCYGFAPIRFDPTSTVSFSRMYHGDDERIPTDGLRWGLPPSPSQSV